MRSLFDTFGLQGRECLREGTTPVEQIDPERLNTMAQFLYDSGVLCGSDGEALAGPGDVTGWIDQSWRSE